MMESVSEFAETLERVGLTKKEALVYLALLQLETATAYQIAGACDVKKPTVYVILEDLRKKGLVLKVPHAKKALFAVQDIMVYLKEQEEKLRSVRGIVPKLHALGKEPRSNVFFFNGLRGIAEAMEHKLERMRGKTFHSFYGNLAGCPDDIVRLYAKWDRKTTASEISFQIIMAQKVTEQRNSDIIELSKKYDSIHIKFLAEYEYPPNQSIEIAEDFLRIVDERDLHATIIDDRATADAMRQIFQIVWEKGV